MCYREMEAYGIGTPVMMFDNGIQLRQPLVPNEHFISLGKKPENPYDAAAIILEKYHSVINDDDFLQYIRENAMEYFDNTWGLENRAKNLRDILRLDRLC